MRFFLARDQNNQTPLELQNLLDMLRAHSITRGELIRDDSSKDWVAIEKHAAFAKLLRGSSSPPPARAQTQRTSPWHIVTAVAAVLSVGGVGALVYLQVRTHDALLTRIDNVARHIDGVLTELRDANALAPFVPSSQVHNNCITDRTTVTCTFTNLQEKPVSTCTQGIVKQKESPGVHLKSMILCTGKLYPSESKVITGSWIGGFADDICYRENGYGKSLDWSKCVFDTEPVDLPTLRKMDAAAQAQ